MTKPSIDKLIQDNNGRLPAHAFPGGYPIVYTDGHNETLCADCATNKYHDPGEWEDWKPQSWFVHYEGSSVFCADCNAEIESAYGDPEED